jgi:hypothetical protein
MINWWAVIVAGIVMFAIGAVWYTALFGERWRQLMSVPEGAQAEGFVPALIVGLIGNLLTAWALAFFVARSNTGSNIVDGLTVAIVAWLGCALPLHANTIIYERRPPMLAYINGGYTLIAYLVMGAILGWWR